MEQISNKAKYAYIIKGLERISKELGDDLAAKIYYDDKDLAEKFFVIVSDIMFDIVGPIIKKYPSLRPTTMVGQKAGRYNIVWYNAITNEETVVCSDILPSSVENEFARIESENMNKKNGFFYMEFHEINVEN